MAADSLVYSLIQIVHNLNAALAFAVPVAWLWHRPAAAPTRAGIALLLGIWALQGLTGAGFGAASVAFYGALPDLHPVALVALLVKVGCVVVALLWCLALMLGFKPAPRVNWGVLMLIAAVALAAAAVLRWNS